MKKLSLIIAMMVCCFSALLAQRTVTGTVTDQDGESLIGASVFVRGTSVGTVTDVDGKFSLEVPEDGNTLVVSYTGFETNEVPLTATNVYDVTLSAGVALDEVVVTGLGIKKEKKALGYGVATIGAEAVANRGESDVARILNGKATGVQIGATSGIAGSGTNIIIRGYSSITGSNQPLFVIDGVPFNSSTNSDRANFAQGSATASSRFLDLDPNNIEEISILKGLSATVLYGEAGRNGVILVTTKTGSGSINANKKLEVSVSQGVSVSEVSNLADYQNVYGNGFSGNYGAFFSNWGPSFDIRGSNGVAADGTIPHPYDNSRNASRLPEFAGQRYPWQAYESVENFFQPGTGYTTSISAKKSFKDASVSAAYSYQEDEGFTPNRGEMVLRDPNDILSYEYVENDVRTNVYQKHNLSLGASANLSNGIKVRGSFNYITSDRINPPAATGGFLSTTQNGVSLFSDVLYTPRSIDLLHLPYEAADGSMVYYRGGSPIQNPMWTLNNSSEEEDIDRFFGNFQIDYEILPWLRAQFRAGIDQFTQYNQFKVNKGGSQVFAADGAYSTSSRVNRIYDHVFNLLYDVPLAGGDFNLDGVVGFNLRGERNDFQFASSTEQFVFDLFNHRNFITQTTNSAITNEKTNGVYGTATLGYKSFLYLGVQLRNDWTSVLEEANRSVFYPSYSLSWIPSDMVNMGTVINYLKVRAGLGTSAGYPDPYVTRSVLGTNPRAFQSGSTLFRTNTVANRLGNPNLTAEKVTEAELGIEARLLDNRIGIDLSLYDKNSQDLLIDLPLDPATGYTITTVNGAEVSNRGIELGLNINPFKGAFRWDAQFNFTKNVNVVESILEGIDQIPIAGFNTIGNFAIPGESYGVIQGFGFERNDDGELLVNSLGEYIETQEIQIIGDPIPNYNLEVINTLSFKGFALSAQLSYVDGGDIYSATALTLLGRGNTTDTGFDRFLPIVLPGVLASDEETPNNIQTYAGDAWFSAYATEEGSVFDGTTLRLREVSLSYALPEKLLESTPFGSLSIKFYGNNLWFRAYNFPAGLNFDPEVLSLGVGNGRGIDLLTGPTARRMGAVINLTF